MRIGNDQNVEVFGNSICDVKAGLCRNCLGNVTGYRASANRRLNFAREANPLTLKFALIRRFSVAGVSRCELRGRSF
jgi:hypothetical protein